jgi:hypothetical protein
MINVKLTESTVAPRERGERGGYPWGTLWRGPGDLRLLGKKADAIGIGPSLRQ